MEAIRISIDSLNAYIAASTFGRIFQLEGSGHEKAIPNTKFTSEVRAGLATFFTMSYIIAVNASILADTGGNCVCNDVQDPFCLKNEEYLICKQELNRSLITTTAAIAGFSSFLFGLTTNMPACLAPGMGLNAYFAYQVVGYHGDGIVSYNVALTAVFIEGMIFLGLSLLGMRQWLVRIIPASLKLACACGIGLFLALIGLSTSAGIGAVTGARSTPLELAGCPDQYKDDNGFCTSHKMTSPKMWIGIMCGGMFTAYLMAYKVKSAIIIGIALVSIISWPRHTAMTFFPDTTLGNDRWEFFQKVVDFQPIDKTLNVLDWNLTDKSAHFALALFTFLYVDIVDCTATLYSMARFCGVVDTVTGDFPRSTIAYCTDAFCISIGALFGTSPVTVFIESGAGIVEGGRTGITAMTGGLCFLLSMFFAPIFASIPPWATGCTLVLVGCLMMRQIVNINWRYIGDAVPAFITVMFIPFGYSTAYGLIAGIMAYTTINGMIFLTRLLTCGFVVPDDEEYREYWTIKPTGRSPWFVSAGHSLVDHVKGGSDRNSENPSIRSSRSAWRHIGSIGSIQELQTVVVDPTDPRLEKVYTKSER